MYLPTLLSRRQLPDWDIWSAILYARMSARIPLLPTCLFWQVGSETLWSDVRVGGVSSYWLTSLVLVLLLFL